MGTQVHQRITLPLNRLILDWCKVHRSAWAECRCWLETISKRSPLNEIDDGSGLSAKMDEGDLQSTDSVGTVGADSSGSRNSVPWEMSARRNNRQHKFARESLRRDGRSRAVLWNSHPVVHHRTVVIVFVEMLWQKVRIRMCWMQESASDVICVSIRHALIYPSFSWAKIRRGYLPALSATSKPTSSTQMFKARSIFSMSLLMRSAI